MLTKNPLFYLTLFLALLAGMLAVNFVKAITPEPIELFPGGTPELPINISSDSQIKGAGLTVNKLVITPAAESMPLYLNEDGICMKENPSTSIVCKSYWDQIMRWSSASGGIYYIGNVGIGMSNLSSGVRLDIGGQLNVNNNRIVNVGSPTVNSDAVTKEYADYTKRTFERELSGSVMNDEDEQKTISLGSDWDFCFLTRFGRNGKGKDKATKIARSRCAVVESGGAWSLVIGSDLKGHTNCKAKCVNFGKAGGPPPAPVPTAPSVPTNFSAEGGSYAEGDGVKLTWNNVNNETGYQIRRDGSSLVSPDQDVTQYIDYSAEPETTHYYEIRACNSSGCSVWAFSISTLGTPPALPTLPSLSTPTNFSAEWGFYAGGDGAKLTWDDVDNETRYEIGRGSNFFPSLNQNVTEYIDYSAESEKSYFYRIQACNDDECSEWGLLNYTTPTPSPPPLSTYTITASAGANGSISPSSVSKTAGQSQTFTATPAAGYTVDQWKLDGGVVNGGSTYTLSNIQSSHSVQVTFEAITYTITPSAGANGSISPSSNFTETQGNMTTFAATPDAGYTVDQWKLDGNVVQTGMNSYALTNIQSDHSVQVTFEVIPPPPPLTPSTPTNFSAEWGFYTEGAGVKLTWDDVSNETRYEIGRGSNSWPALNQNAIEYIDYSAETETSYYYRIQACNNDGCSDWSTVNITTPSTPSIPSTPTNFSAEWGSYTAGDGVKLTWDDVNNETGYEIQKNGSSLISPNQDVTECVDYGVGLGTTYSYDVRACNSSGCSGWNSLTYSTPSPSVPVPPNAPANFEVIYNTTTNELNLSWDDVNNETGYEIEYSVGVPTVMLDKNDNWAWLMPSIANALKEIPPSEWTALVSLNANTISYSTTKDSDYGKYWYSIRACNNGGCSIRTTTEAEEITSGGGNSGGTAPPSQKPQIIQ